MQRIHLRWLWRQREQIWNNWRMSRNLPEKGMILCTNKTKTVDRDCNRNQKYSFRYFCKFIFGKKLVERFEIGFDIIVVQKSQVRKNVGWMWERWPKFFQKSAKTFNVLKFSAICIQKNSVKCISEENCIFMKLPFWAISPTAMKDISPF
jgi:hypothetical protein